MKAWQYLCVSLLVGATVSGCSTNSLSNPFKRGTSSPDMMTQGLDGAPQFSEEDNVDWQERSLLAKRTYYFAFDRFELSQEDRQALEAHAKYLVAHPEAKIRIEGHTDERGSREYNISLGERRAKAALDILVANGVETDRIALVSYGKENPVDPRHNEEAWERNRRAILVYEVS